MKTATRIAYAGAGSAWIYSLSEPLEGTDYVLVSAIYVSLVGVAETYIFPCDAEGNVTSWDELPGSQKGTMCHATVLGNAGYEIQVAA